LWFDFFSTRQSAKSSNPKKDQQDIQQEIDALKKWLKAKELILPVEDIFSDEISYFEKVSTKELPQLDLANISDDYAMSYVLVSWSPDNIKQQRSGASVRRLKTVNNLLKNIQAAMEDQELHTLVTNILDNLPKGPHRLLSFFASSKLEDKLIEANNKHFPLDNQNKSICQIM
jgi:hypothetical protein